MLTVFRHAYFRGKESLYAKPMEWLMTTVLIIWGLDLMEANEVFAGPSFSAFGSLMSEEAWARVCLGLGVIRLAILAINGALWKSPHLRAAAAFLTSGFWFVLALSFAMSEGDTPAGKIYLAYMVADLFNAHRASREAGRYDQKPSREADSGRAT